MHPRLEGRRRDDLIERHRQFEAILLREKRIDIEHAQFIEGRVLHLQDNVFKRQIFALFPGILENIGDQHMLAIAHRFDIDPDQREQGGHNTADTLTVDFFIACPTFAGRLQRIQNTDRQSGVRAGRINAELRSAFHGSNAARHNTPTAKAVAPLLRHILRIFGRLHTGAASIIHIDPRREIFRAQFGKGQKQVSDVAFRIDHDRRNIIEHGFFKQRDTQAGFTAARHANDDRMSRQVARIIIHHFIVKFVRIGVIAPPHVKGGGRFNKRHIRWPLLKDLPNLIITFLEQIF